MGAPISLPPQAVIRSNVAAALAEDVGDGDLTAALVVADETADARVLVREAAVLCGTAWFDEALRQVDPELSSHWEAEDGETLTPDQTVCRITGPARTLLTAERTGLNFLQLLSGVASVTRRYAELVAHTAARVLDTRKTLPGLRLAQKYAVRCGGGTNHRIGLFDAYLIKENHIAAAGSIGAAIRTARATRPDVPLEVEIERLDQLDEAVAAAPDRIMLDNFPLADLRAAVARRPEGIELEASGGVEGDTLVAVAETGVDFISIGALTKHVRATDFSMRF